MSSLSSLRWKIGTLLERNRWSIGVFGAIFNEAGEILLVRARGQTKWSLPGGGVSETDIKKTPIEDELFVFTLFRELQEELNLLPKAVLRLSDPQFFVSCKLQDLSFVYVLWLEEGAEDILMPQEEIEEIGFFAKEKLPPLLGPRMMRMVQWAFERHALG